MKAQEPILAYLQERLRERIESMENHLKDGGCQTFEAYRFTVGYLEAMNRAESELLAVDEMQRRGEDLEEHVT